MDKGLVSSGLVGAVLLEEGLAGYGLVGGESGLVYSHVWILSSDVVPQPTTVKARWTDDGLFIDANIWYD